MFSIERTCLITRCIWNIVKEKKIEDTPTGGFNLSCIYFTFVKFNSFLLSNRQLSRVASRDLVFDTCAVYNESFALKLNTDQSHIHILRLNIRYIRLSLNFLYFKIFSCLYHFVHNVGFFLQIFVILMCSMFTFMTRY